MGEVPRKPNIPSLENMFPRDVRIPNMIQGIFFSKRIPASLGEWAWPQGGAPSVSLPFPRVCLFGVRALGLFVRTAKRDTLV